MSTLKAAEAQAHQRVALEEDERGNGPGAREVYLLAAKLYLDAVEQSPIHAQAELWRQEAELCMTRAAALGGGSQTHGHTSGDSEIMRRGGLREYVSTFRIKTPSHNLSDVVGLTEAKDAAKALLDFIAASRDQALLDRHPAYRPPMGVVLEGPPGTGKSHFAEGLAGEIIADDGTFYRVSAAQLKSKWYGETLRIISALFQVARETAPSVVFIDEIDSVATKREHLDSDSDRQLVTQFLNEIGGVRQSKNSPVFVIGATNMPLDSLDPALFRAGRIELSIHVGLPKESERVQLFQRSLRGEPAAPDVNIELLAHRTEGWSGADIDLACRLAVAEVVRAELQDETKGSVTQKHLENSMDRVHTNR